VVSQSGLFAGVFSRGGVDTSDGAWLQAMLDTEAALARALERAGLAGRGAGEAVTALAQAAAFDAAEIGRLAAQTGNPVPALVRALTSRVPGEAAAAVHMGATSQDVMDTAAMLLARRALGQVAGDLSAAADATARLAERHRDTIMIGRTLLQQAVPVTFGLVAAGWLAGLEAARAQITEVAENGLAVQYGGAAGTLAAMGDVGPQVVALLAEELGLAAPLLPWHTDRQRVLRVAAACAAAAAILGKIARDVTLLAQSEVGEVAEGNPVAVAEVHPAEVAEANPAQPDGRDGGGRGGSSAMPHKHNPVGAIAVLGCTKQVPGLVASLMAAAEQEHQRAAGAWHAEWEPYGAVLRLTGSAACWAAEMLAGLQVDQARMRAHLDAARGLPMAEAVASLLAPALGSVAAHDLIAEAAAAAAARGQSLRAALLESEQVAGRLDAAGISPGQVEAALDPANYLGAAGHFVDAALAAHRKRAEG
jgi:3-carboxy-cis,cis-muconate cycloisomerase